MRHSRTPNTPTQNEGRKNKIAANYGDCGFTLLDPAARRHSHTPIYIFPGNIPLRSSCEATLPLYIVYIWGEPKFYRGGRGGETRMDSGLQRSFCPENRIIEGQ